jgi:hypothetical protein
LLFVRLLFLCTITHTAFSGIGSGCFLAVELNINEEKWETGLGYHGKYEEPWKTSSQGLTMISGLLEELFSLSPFFPPST